MSINVHVSGNPVKIHKGKMVTSQDVYQCKKDFEKRRLLRLQQVRQQSKDIAQDVRNKVKKEKQKQIGEIEKEGEEKLKNWQNKKLMELQSQYKEALAEIGMGHEEAEFVKMDEENYRIEKMKNDTKAKEREQYAMLESQDEREDRERNKNRVKELKKVAREKENLRSKEVITKFKSTSIKKPSPKKPKPLANINISVPDNIPHSTSENEENYDRLSLISEEASQEIEESSCSCPETPSNYGSNQTATKRVNSIPSTSDVNTRTNRVLESQDKYIQTSTQRLDSLRKDTRISDRIKRRDKLVNEPDYCEEIAPINPNTVLGSNTKIRDAIYSRPPLTKVCDCGTSPTYSMPCNCCCSRAKVIECKCKLKDVPGSPKKKLNNGVIPEKPTVRLKSTSEKFGTVTSIDSNQVSYYEHKNKYDGKTQMASTVEKISHSDLEVDNLPDDKEYYDKMKQRDQEAILRAKKALEKEKIQRDYKEIMQKLPLLQKQEKLAKLNTDKPEYHMNDERRQELERKRQNQLDNAYTNLFPNLEPKIVTLPSRSDPGVSRGSRNSPNASWDVDYKEPKLFTANEVQDIVLALSEPNNQDKKTKFKELLKNLKMQKKQLLDQARKMPRDDSVIQLLRELNEHDDSTPEERHDKPRRRTKSRSDKKSKYEELSTVSEESEYERPKSADLERRKTPTKKRPKSKPIVIVKQNMSTQTTPKLTPEDAAVQRTSNNMKTSSKIETKSSNKTEARSSSKTEPKTSGKSESKSTSDVSKKTNITETQNLCNKKHTECDCLKNDDGKFEIVIQINDDNPVVTVTDKGKITATNVSNTVTDDKKTSDVTSGGSRKFGSKLISNHSKSWKDQFSKNSTTSTSYYSPPGASPGTSASLYNSQKSTTKNNSTEVADESQPRNPQLFDLVAKLLDMSKSSIENLPVSSSSMSTPNQSVVEIESNIPPNPLHDILKYIAQHLNDQQPQQQQQPTYGSTLQNETLNMSCDVTLCPSSRIPQDETRTDNFAEQYAIITDNTSKKIEHLAAQIQLLREEKSKILEKSVEVDGRENSTTYLEHQLPFSSGSESSISEEELYWRFKNLIEPTVPVPEEKDKSNGFVPLLADLPKLPKFENVPVETGRKKPPPSKGLSVARRYNDEIYTIPHELSAIPEAERESHVSSKADISKCSVKSRNSSAEEIVVPEEPKVVKNANLTSDSSEGVETLEQMLKSIGMEWAIPTLQKTKKALELTSSSTEDSGKNHSGNDTTLLKYLKTQLMSKISSSTLLGNTSQHSLSGDFPDVSVIPSVSIVKERTQKTSTPVQSVSGGSQDSLRKAFYSDLSSVKSSNGSK